MHTATCYHNNNSGWLAIRSTPNSLQAIRPTAADDEFCVEKIQGRKGTESLEKLMKCTRGGRLMKTFQSNLYK